MSSPQIHPWFGPVTPPEPEELDDRFVLDPARQAAPRYRGQARYYRRLATDSPADHLPPLEETAYFHGWHIHPDRENRGNVSKRAREQHLDHLFRGLRDLCTKLETVEGPIQCFAIINPFDSSRDALYVNSPNPHATFPYRFDHRAVQWGITPPDLLIPYLAGEAWELGRAEGAGGTEWLVRPTGRLNGLAYPDIPPQPFDRSSPPLKPTAAARETPATPVSRRPRR